MQHLTAIDEYLLSRMDRFLGWLESYGVVYPQSRRWVVAVDWMISVWAAYALGLAAWPSGILLLSHSLFTAPRTFRLWRKLGQDAARWDNPELVRQHSAYAIYAKHRFAGFRIMAILMVLWVFSSMILVGLIELPEPALQAVLFALSAVGLRFVSFGFDNYAECSIPLPPPPRQRFSERELVPTTG